MAVWGSNAGGNVLFTLGIYLVHIHLTVFLLLFLQGVLFLPFGQPRIALKVSNLTLNDIYRHVLGLRDNFLAGIIQSYQTQHSSLPC